LSREDAYAQLVAARLAPAIVSTNDIRAALIDNIVDGEVAGVPVETLDTQEARLAAYLTLAQSGTVPTTPTEDEIDAALAAHTFFESYAERSSAVTDAANATLQSIEINLMANQALDFSLDALSLGSIYFPCRHRSGDHLRGDGRHQHGPWRVHHDGRLHRLCRAAVRARPDTLSILIALPLAFAVTFGAGVAMERLIIRWLYHRPLETLLATFGISIALQQLAKNIFGTQARPFTAPDWLTARSCSTMCLDQLHPHRDLRARAGVPGALPVRHEQTRLGLEVRAVTQNPKMAASMGINPDKINMLTFGFGSGIAGIAGVAIGLFGQVTTEMGQQYIVQSFMTVVVGGVGSVWGTLAGAGMIGGLQKFIEFLNPSNTLAAQTYMILFIILFIQFRPRGIVALKGRAAEM
jgi:urea transport system permease protein